MTDADPDCTPARGAVPEPARPGRRSVLPPGRGARDGGRGDERVLPPVARPRGILWLWVLVALLTAGALLVGLELYSWSQELADPVAEAVR